MSKKIIRKKLTEKKKPGTTTLYHNTPEAQTFRKKIAQEKAKPVSLEDIQKQIAPICSAYSKIVEVLQAERKRKLSLQTFVGEAVLYELLHQSYGIPEYSDEERLKRILSAVLEATKNHRNQPPLLPLESEDLIDLWWKPEDPHHLETVNPDPSVIRLRKLWESVADKEMQDSTRMSNRQEKILEYLKDREFLKNLEKPEKFNVLIQHNGKTLNEILIPANTSREEVEKLCLERVKTSLKKKIKKVVIVPDKLVNFITD